MKLNNLPTPCSNQMVNYYLMKGLDSDGKHVYSLNAASLPPFSPRIYNELYEVIIEKLDHLNTSNYTLIFFCSGGVDSSFLPWSWIITHYYRLDQRLRKNLSALYIVHSNGWSRMVFVAMGFILRLYCSDIAQSFPVNCIGVQV